jgi:hypothetical protein
LLASNLFGGKTPIAECFSHGRWIDGRTGVPTARRIVSLAPYQPMNGYL